MKSSSFHKITSDRGNILYKIFARFVHTPLNFINNFNASKNIDKKLKISYFKILNFEEQYKKLEKLSSPSRKLSDLFWMSQNWKEIKDKLKEINICDIGCGNGNYYLKLQKYSNNKITNYKGLDIYENKNWESLKQKNKIVSFEKYDGKNIVNLIPKNTNLIISQSAIEHFSEDITIFKQIKAFVKKSKHPVYQIHLFPSKVCLKLYPFHGVRQYTPRNISKITRLFSDFSEVELFELGGENANKVHIDYITKGLFKKDKRKNNPDIYENACFEALKKDLTNNKTSNPNFYTLVIKYQK